MNTANTKSTATLIDGAYIYPAGSERGPAFRVTRRGLKPLNYDGCTMRSIDFWEPIAQRDVDALLAALSAIKPN